MCKWQVIYLTSDVAMAIHPSLFFILLRGVFRFVDYVSGEIYDYFECILAEQVRACERCLLSGACVRAGGASASAIECERCERQCLTES